MCRRTSMEYVTEAILNLRMAVKAHASLVGKSIPRPKLQKILKELDAEYDKTLKQKTRERTIRQLLAAFLSIAFSVQHSVTKLQRIRYNSYVTSNKGENNMKKSDYIKLINDGMKKMKIDELLMFFGMLKDFNSTNAWYEKTIERM